MKLDYEEYRPMLAKHNLTREHEDEILEYLWHFTGTLVDQAFGLDPVQLASKRNQK